MRVSALKVSIPFKRESVSQAFILYPCIRYFFQCFNSLQTGKRITREAVIADAEITMNTFPFPSNGKADHKSELTTYHVKQNDKFPFPSNGKAYHKAEWAGSAGPFGSGFHSLQTGKPIQRIYRLPVWHRVSMFPFPSNGKAYPKYFYRDDLLAAAAKFPFPSNGKADCEEQLTTDLAGTFNRRKFLVPEDSPVGDRDALTKTPQKNHN